MCCIKLLNVKFLKYRILSFVEIFWDNDTGRLNSWITLKYSGYRGSLS